MSILNITLNKKNDTEGSLVVNMLEKDYSERVEGKLKEYAKKASVKGFRPGKVPVGMIKKMYGTSVLVEEINTLLSESVEKYLKEEDVKYIGRPMPKNEESEAINWDTQKEFEFSYDIGLVPEFSLNLAKLKVDKYIIKDDKKLIDETIENICQQHATSEPVDVSKEGDFIAGKLIGEGFDKEILLPTNQLKKEKKSFVGTKKGAVVNFDLQKAFGKDESAIAHLTGLTKDEAKNLKGKYNLTVDTITRSINAKVDQDLFDKTFGKDEVKSEDEFRSKIEKTIGDNYDREADGLLSRKIMEKLVEKTKFDLSRDFLSKFIKASNEKLSQEEIDKSLDDYVTDLKWTLIRNEYIREDSVEVSNEEVVESARARMMGQFNIPTMTPELAEKFEPIVDNFLKEDNGRNYMNEYENILTGKVLEKMRGKVSVKEKKVSIDDFNKEAKRLAGG